MSKKGRSPYNLACEGFSNASKNDLFYGRDWKGVAFEEFSHLLNDYIDFYIERCIKKSLGWMSSSEYHRSLGIVT